MSQATVRTFERVTAAGSRYVRAPKAPGWDDLDAAAGSWVATQDPARTNGLLKNVISCYIACKIKIQGWALSPPFGYKRVEFYFLKTWELHKTKGGKGYLYLSFIYNE